jgi:hypothetical protein
MLTVTGMSPAVTVGLTVTCTLCEWRVEVVNLCSIPEECRVCSHYALLINKKTASSLPVSHQRPPVLAPRSVSCSLWH